MVSQLLVEEPPETHPGFQQLRFAGGCMRRQIRLVHRDRSPEFGVLEVGIVLRVLTHILLPYAILLVGP
jgi:hypothetical protein